MDLGSVRAGVGFLGRLELFAQIAVAAVFVALCTSYAARRRPAA